MTIICYAAGKEAYM